MKAVEEILNKKDANLYLKAGWKLLAAAGGQWQESQEPCIKYSFGWDQESEPVKPKLY